MAIKQTKPFSKCNARHHEYIIDNDEDVQNLPTTCAAGSTALSCATANIFIMNASGEWVLFGGEADA